MHNSINMRVLVVLIVFAAALSVACGPSSQESQTRSDALTERGARDEEARYKVEPPKQRGGRLTMTSVSFGNPNDPHLVITATGRTFSVPITNGLVKGDVYTKGYPIIADLAKSWDISKDGTTYTFKLHEGVKFHNVPPVNGREFTSEDAKYNLLRVTAHPSVIVEKWRARYQRAVDFGDIQSIETPDKYTLVVKLKESYAPFLDALAFPGTQMLPREFVESFPEKIILEGMIGTGPFLPVEYKNQQIATYKRNPEYWKKDSEGNQLPYLDELASLYFADDTSRLAAFRARNLDMASAGTKTQLESVTRDMPDTRVLITPSSSLNNFRFNIAKVKAFQDIRVRKAMHLATDRHQLIELVEEGIAVPAGPVTPTYASLANSMDWLLSQPGYRKDKKEDLAEAKRLMKEAGYEDGFTLEVMLTSSQKSADLASLFLEQMKPLNITLKPELVDYAGQWLPRSTQGEFQLSNVSHALATDADAVLSPHFLSDGPRNYGKFNDPVADDLIRKQRLAVTVEERRKYAQEAEKRLLEMVPMIFMYNPSIIQLAQPWVHNAGDAGFSGGAMHTVEKAWVEKH